MLATSVSQLVRGYFTGSKNTHSGSHRKVSFPEPAAYYWKKRDSWKCLLCLFSLSSPCITGYELASDFLWNCFCRILKHRHDLNEKCHPVSCPEKSICDEEVWYACLFHPCGSQEKTFITALLCADKVSLFIQSGRDKPWMRHCRTARERERESDAGQRGKTRKQLGIQLLVCVHVSRWHLLESHLCSVRRLERWPAALTPLQLPPRALLPALIHSHCETACIMLSNRNNPQEMEHPMDSRVWGRKMAKGLRIKGAI